jgi:hypothetical protein
MKLTDLKVANVGKVFHYRQLFHAEPSRGKSHAALPPCSNNCRAWHDSAVDCLCSRPFRGVPAGLRRQVHRARPLPRQDSRLQRLPYAGYAESSGAIPEKQWLTGSPVGWRGPWGTTYPANIRLSMSRIDEARWVEIGHTTQFRPPMPWFALRDMRTEDLRAIYRFVRYLGPAGSPAPDFVPPGKAPSGPYIQFPGEAN